MARAVDDLGVSARGVDAAALGEVIRRLQPLRARLRQDLGECRGVPTDASGVPLPAGPASGGPTGGSAGATPTG